MAKHDILDLEDLESVIRQLFEKGKEISLDDFNTHRESIPADYKTISIQLKEGEPSEMRAAIEPISEKFEEDGYGPQLFTALYEAVLNAFQHGNQKDPSKIIKVGHKIGEDQLDIMVEDKGGKLNPNFIPYILEHRDERYKKHFVDFYTFSGKERPDKNCGSGIMFMHQYTDKVNYYHAEDGGLIVHMIKKK